MDNIQEQILAELKKQNEYFEKMDWKLWMLQNMIKAIAEENGYTFDIEENTATVETYEEPVERTTSDLKPKYDDSNWSLE